MRLICRPLACPEPSLLIMAHGRSPTRNPDPAALQRLARETIPTNIQADDLRVDTASKGHVHLKLGKSEVATVRGFPAVVVDYQRTGVGRPDYAVRTIVFAGLNMITVTSASKSPAVAHQNMDDAIAAMDILDMPPPPSPKVGASNPPAHEAVADAKK
ncbi:MAG TPA: hypothetical protein PKA55_11685 [Rhodoblastus sp.]|nr:hypothetical protein [Rhodoblastus sp.]